MIEASASRVDTMTLDRLGVDASPYLLLLTGPAGAGKTAAAASWAASQKHPTTHLSLDDVRDFVRSGYANPEDGWTAEAQRQYELARTACCTLARLYISAGFNCVIDDVIFPNWRPVSYDAWRPELEGIPHKLVILLPDFSCLPDRNRGRRGHRQLTLTTLRTIYDMMLPWRDQGDFPVIETTGMSVAETVIAIQSQVDRTASRW